MNHRTTERRQRQARTIYTRGEQRRTQVRRIKGKTDKETQVKIVRRPKKPGKQKQEKKKKKERK